MHRGRYHGAEEHVSDAVIQSRVNRRDLLLGAIFLVGGAAALTRFTGRGAGNRMSATALSAEQFALLEQVAEVIVPTTDTPGAIAAGAPAFIRDLLENWSSAQTRAQIFGVLEAIERASWSKFGAAFLELAPERRLDIMSVYDADAVAKQDPAYGRFKYLVLVGYYHSEVGATQELRFELVPGAWRACVPLSEIGRASAVGA
jgi:gluconate 2-dehydrogenase gamma chain